MLFFFNPCSSTETEEDMVKNLGYVLECLKLDSISVTPQL